jgi:hypothetical protein
LSFTTACYRSFLDFSLFLSLHQRKEKGFRSFGWQVDAMLLPSVAGKK